MKLLAFIIIIALAAVLAPEAQARQREQRGNTGSRTQTSAERTISAAPEAVVSICLNTGDVVVRGWDRSEVQARVAEPAAVRFQPTGGEPSRRIEVVVSGSDESMTGFGECGSVERVELFVPRGASLSLRARSGNTEISDVADVRVDSFSGDVSVSRFSRAVEINSMSGSVSVSDGTGRARLRAVSGEVEAARLRRLDDNDVLDASSTSGDVILRDVSYTRVRGATISGDVVMTGDLARGGSYDFKTISGDVVLTLPTDASFKLHATVVSNGDIFTDFSVVTAPESAAAAVASAPPVMPQPPVMPAPNPQPAPAPTVKGHGKVKVGPPHPGIPNQTRLIGTVGAGDADLRLSSFNGTLRLKRRQ